MKRVYTYCIVILLSGQLFAQLPVEVGVMSGATFYNGDLGSFVQSGIGPAFGAYGRYSFDFPMAVRLNLAYGSVSVNDKVHPESGLSFRTPVTEYSMQLEVFITRPKSGYRNYSVKSGRRKYYVYNFPVVSYAFIGIGRFHFNPKGQYTDGSWKALQPLCTEGQGVFPTRESPYKLASWQIPIGAGIHFPFTGSYHLGFEIGIRKTFTDYFDDASLTYVNTTVLESAKGPIAAYFADPSQNKQLTTTSPAAARGNPKNKDAYMFAFVTLQYDFAKVKKKKSFRI